MPVILPLDTAVPVTASHQSLSSGFFNVVALRFPRGKELAMNTSYYLAHMKSPRFGHIWPRTQQLHVALLTTSWHCTGSQSFIPERAGHFQQPEWGGAGVTANMPKPAPR